MSNDMQNMPDDEQLEALLDEALGVDDAPAAQSDEAHELAQRIVAATRDSIVQRRTVVARLYPMRIGAVAAAVVALAVGGAAWMAQMNQPARIVPESSVATANVEKVLTAMDQSLDASGSATIDLELHLLSVAIGELESIRSAPDMADPLDDELWFDEGDFF